MIYPIVSQAIVALGIEEEEIDGGKHLRGDFELDSTDVVELELELKRKLGIDLKLELDDDPTVDDVCALAEKAQATADA